MNIEQELITETNNFRKGRNGKWSIDTIVIHVEEGTEESAESWFNASQSHVSAHYGNDKNGSIEQWVLEEDTAYANGRVDHPTAKCVLDRIGSNPNDWTISIEHEGDGTQPLTVPQKLSTVALIQDICKRRNIPIDRKHIIGHHEIYSLKPCPGKIDVDELVKLAGTVYQNPTMGPIVIIPKVVYSDYFEDYVVVTSYTDDNNWTFMPIKKIVNSLKAQTPLSQMPLEPHK